MRRRPLLGSLAATAGATLQAAPAWAPGAAAQTLPPRALRAPAVLAQAAFLLDVETGAALFQKFPDARRPMASTTKLMTALLAVISGHLDEVTTVSRLAATVGETSMGLYEGERISVRDLLFGLLMNSGNDAAIAIAEQERRISGNTPAVGDVPIAVAHLRPPGQSESGGFIAPDALDPTLELIVLAREHLI